MFGLNIKVTAFMLVNMLAVHGKIYREDKYLSEPNHVEHYQRFYSDNGRSDIFGNTNNKFFLSGSDMGITGFGNGIPNMFPDPLEDTNGDEMPSSYAFPALDEDNSNLEDLDLRKLTLGSMLPDVFPVEENGFNMDMSHSFGFNSAGGLPFPFPVENTMNQDNNRPWFPDNVNDEMRPRPGWVTPPSSGVNGVINQFPNSKPGRGEMKRKCQNIKGLPASDSGCCGVQMTKPPVDEYPNKPWWPQVPEYQGGRFTRSADKDTLPSGMIRGGTATDLHQFPWMVRLSIDTAVPGIGTPKSCGGTIISNRYVITAAHCLYGTFKNLKQLTVILAEYNSDTYPKDCNGQGCVLNKMRNVDHVIMHPKFNNTYLHNDVALLRLSEDIPYSDFIRPVCLPTKDVSALKEEPLIIAGWGLNGKTESNLKRSAIVNYVSNNKCEEEYSYKDKSMFCSIGGNGEDICHGDSGGPLMVHTAGKFFLSGIVNGKRNTEECGSKVPSLFNNVFHHLKWIKSHVR